MYEERFISCDEGEEFVLTEYGFEISRERELNDGREVGKPIKGFEQAVPEKWYVRGYVEKVDKNE